jgi:hypothetical protein
VPRADEADAAHVLLDILIGSAVAASQSPARAHDATAVGLGALCELARLVGCERALDVMRMRLHGWHPAAAALVDAAMHLGGQPLASMRNACTALFAISAALQRTVAAESVGAPPADMDGTLELQLKASWPGWHAEVRGPSDSGVNPI